MLIRTRVLYVFRVHIYNTYTHTHTHICILRFIYIYIICVCVCINVKLVAGIIRARETKGSRAINQQVCRFAAGGQQQFGATSVCSCTCTYIYIYRYLQYIHIYIGREKHAERGGIGPEGSWAYYNKYLYIFKRKKKQFVYNNK